MYYRNVGINAVSNAILNAVINALSNAVDTLYIIQILEINLDKTLLGEYNQVMGTKGK